MLADQGSLVEGERRVLQCVHGGGQAITGHMADNDDGTRVMVVVMMMIDDEGGGDVRRSEA